MKKHTFALTLIVILVLSAGCSRLNNTRSKKSTATNQINSQVQENTDTLDLDDENLNELDSIINNKDLTSDIPTSVDPKK